jgi:hypothetical protein
VAHLDRSYVGKLESGRHRWPNSRYRAAFQQVLGVADPAGLGFCIVRGQRAEPIRYERPAGEELTAVVGGAVAGGVSRRSVLGAVPLVAAPGLVGLSELVAALTSWEAVGPAAPGPAKRRFLFGSAELSALPAGLLVRPPGRSSAIATAVQRL